ncbi:hypothetical protein KHA93_11605 [Bacillus sp. FJAT-49732]|uniref:Uncharacterized protein n=1 Tax=Lederbergia citrisecunda TaxID=2833583 RepID=A0A942TL86_9BACI|nr:hypothetical protein [Lederbergia citrisecunda]MBS4200276.1 hypothetical protein [Lederbergia citrisecunda]
MTWADELLLDLDPPKVLSTGVSNNRTSFFVMNGKCYIMDGVNYLEYDGTTVKAVTPYIPTISISKDPEGGGIPYEDFNLLGSGFKDSFSADGTATVFQLSLTGLATTKLTAVVNGTTMNEDSGFTVDRSTGKVTFSTAPDKGTNNVVITAYKTQSGFPERIKKCRLHVLFGGSNDTRVFVSGNKDMPEYIWSSELYDPSYFPENRFYKYWDKVMGFSKQYDYLVVERANGKHQITFDLSDGVSSFPSKPINDQVGTIATNSIQIVENNPVSLARDGIYMLVASNVRDERNVQRISEAVDAKLLREPNLENAISIDYDQKYWLAVNGNVYVFDYAIDEWYLYDNIHADCFIEMNGDLYFGSSVNGLIYRFKKETDMFPYNDDGKFINAYWKSAKIGFGSAERNKLIQKLFATIAPGKHTSCDFYYVSDKVSFPRNEENLPDYSIMHYGKSFYNDKIFDAKTEFINSTRTELFDYSTFIYSLFSYNASEQPTMIVKKVKAKKVVYYQLVIQNNRIDESLKIESLGLKYILQNYRK